MTLTLRWGLALLAGLALLISVAYVATQLELEDDE